MFGELGDSEVSQLDMAIHCYENVIRLDIVVNNFVRVQTLQSKEDLRCVELCLRFTKRSSSLDLR